MNTTSSPADDDTLASARDRVAALQAELEAAEGAPVRLIETHISWVLLTPTLAYKLKKPVRLPFLDFTSLAARRRCCDEEVRLNRRLAPSLYLDVIEVCDGPRGPAFGAGGPVLDVAVRMRRFPDGALWSEMLAAGTLGPQHVDAMAQRLAGFHAEAAVAAPDSRFGSAAVHQRIAGRLIDALDPLAGHGDTRALRAWLQAELQSLAPWWESRRQDGGVRECHGDLHLANVLQLGEHGEQAGAFDGIEFDEELRWIDVLDDVAFLVMDLMAHERRGLGFRLLNAYLETSGDYAGLPALRFFMVCRALVRAQVAAIGQGQRLHSAATSGAGDYLAVARSLAHGRDARLAITHGLPGTGKTFVSQGLVEAAGALRVRSDVERKRLFGLSALQRSHGRVPGGIYDGATTQRTYARLAQVAETALRAGWPVIVDAAFLRSSERGAFAALAQRLHVPFSIIDCTAPLQLLRERLERRQARGGDASEADVAVLERLAPADEALDADEADEAADALVVDAAGAFDAPSLAARWLEARAR
ncbi:MAG TPA: AAA family ATPase [Albitalea sp.]